MTHYTFIGYAAACGITLLICWIAYRMFLESKTAPTLNRKIVLSIYGLMLAVPVLTVILPSFHVQTSIELGELQTFFISDTTETFAQHPATVRAYNLLRIITAVYITGMILMALRTTVSTWQLWRIHRKSTKIEIDGTSVFLHENSDLSSYSWLNRIYVYKEVLSMTSTNRRALLDHETSHVSNHHFIDLIVAQAALIFQWFNPAAWMLRAELQRIHEYEADSDVLKTGIDEKTYQNLLIDNITRKGSYSLTDGINNCSLKKRIVMMKTKNFKKGTALRAAFVLMAAISAGALLNVRTIASTLTTSTPAGASVEAKQIEAGLKSFTQPSSSQIESVNETVPDNDKKTEPLRVMEIKPNKETVEIYEAPEVMPKYGDGSDNYANLMHDLAINIRYPENAYKNNIQGKVVVKFVVNTDGQVEDITVINKVDDELDQAAIDAIKVLPGKWKPGTNGGKPVNCFFTLPVTFKLASDKQASEETN